MGCCGQKVKSGKRRLEPPWVGGEVDGEPALRALAADRLGDLTTDRVDSGDVTELHAGGNGKVNLDELGASDLGDIARVGLETVAGDDGIHDAPDMRVELRRGDQQDFLQRFAPRA